MDRRPKILWNAVSAKSGGASTYITNLVSSLSVDHTLQHVVFVPSRLALDPRDSGAVSIRPTDVGCRSPMRRLLWDQISLRRIVARERVDMLVSTSDFGMLNAPCFQILLVRNPTFFSEHYLNHILPRKSWRARSDFAIRKRLVCLSACRADLVVTATHAMMNDLRKHVHLKDSTTFVNPFGVPLERFPSGRHQLGRAQQGRPFRFLYVSEYGDYKNLTVLLEAVRLLALKGDPGIRLVTTADPAQFQNVEMVSRRRDRELAADPKVAPYVTFTGPVQYGDMRRVYQEADAFVFPSLAESFGHPLVEAMAMGLPIIASALRVHREICDRAALYHDPFDSGTLARLMLQLSRTTDLRETLARVGQQRVVERFQWKAHVGRFHDLIGEILQNGQGAGGRRATLQKQGL